MNPHTPKSSQFTFSIRRNELIADLFFRLHKVERIGMGIRKMKEAMDAAGLREPLFEPDGFFRAIFYRSPALAMKEETISMEKGTRLLGEKEPAAQNTIQETTRKILDLIRRQPSITRQQLAQILGTTDNRIKHHLRKMRVKGIILRIGPDKGGHWEVDEAQLIHTDSTAQETIQITTQIVAQNTTQKILDLIRKQPSITRQELAAQLGITGDGIKYHLRKMQAQGILRRIGPDKGGHWKTIE